MVNDSFSYVQFIYAETFEKMFSDCLQVSFIYNIHNGIMDSTLPTRHVNQHACM